MSMYMFTAHDKYIFVKVKLKGIMKREDGI
jgi:hypothetical protein